MSEKTPTPGRRRTERKNVTIGLPAELHDWYFRHAVDCDVSLSKLIYAALEYYRIERSKIITPAGPRHVPFKGGDFNLAQMDAEEKATRFGHDRA